jgi:hypothetical protein
VLVDYFLIWDMMDGVILRQDVPDHYKWKLTQHGTCSSKSAYEAFFLGSIKFGPWRRIRKTWAPPRCKLFIWLFFRSRVWTADCLARRNFPHPDACPFCDQEEETINHLLIRCVFAREVWTLVVQNLGLPHLAPQPATICFSRWWRKTTTRAPKETGKDLNSLIILVAWEI